MRSVVWFRDDLRVADNPALYAACESGEVVAVFVRCDAQWREHGVGGRRLSFVRRSLSSLATDLERLNIPLKLLVVDRFADVPARLNALVDEVHASTLHFNAEYPLDEARRDTAVQHSCEHAGVRVVRHHGGVILPPGAVVTGGDRPYTVYTPFKRRWLERLSASEREPLPIPAARPRISIASDPLTPFPAERGDVDGAWPAGADAARSRLVEFVTTRLARYDTARDVPGVDGTSRLSPHLATGALSARQCLAAIGKRRSTGAAAWLNELVWRDFYRHVVAFFPDVSKERPFRARTEHVRWRRDPDGLAAWRRGTTGYPLVDAGMRQLLHTGWMHNRVRMVTAMFLAKHLLIDWREGERHFMETLVDADFAANNGGWQWSASTGTDAAPYFRIFNPVAQAQRVDPDGVYVRRWVPELADVPLELVFEPWRSPLESAPYPPRIVEHDFARKRALDAFKG